MKWILQITLQGPLTRHVGLALATLRPPNGYIIKNSFGQRAP
jgi:hypothetical protein